MFFKKWKNIEKYDIKNLIPILIQSICRGETVFGFKDKKRSHYARVVWSSLFGAAAIGGLAAAADDNSDKNTFRENAAQEMESNMSNVVNRIVDKNLNIAPTIIIRPGYKFNIIVDKDLILRPYEEEAQ